MNTPSSSTPKPRTRKKKQPAIRHLVPSSSTVVSPDTKKRRGKKAPREEMNPEDLFYFQIVAAGLPLPVREHLFMPGRRFRFDFAFLDLGVAFEVEGGIWSRGRHIRPEGFLRDMLKYNMANLLGWRVYRVSTEQVRDGSALELLKQALELATARLPEKTYHVLPPVPKTGVTPSSHAILSSGKPAKKRLENA